MQTNLLQANQDYGSRRKRRDAVKSILVSLLAIRNSEQRCLDNLPENFQCTESFEVGECAVETLDEIIALLTDVY
jgi:hypothetical protein